MRESGNGLRQKISQLVLKERQMDKKVIEVGVGWWFRVRRERLREGKGVIG